jgi:hypothetical protein
MHTERKPRTFAWAIAGFSVAGLIQLGLGLYWVDNRMSFMGGIVLVGAFLSAATLFAVRLRAAPARNPAIPPAITNSRKLEFDYEPAAEVRNGAAPTPYAERMLSAHGIPLPRDLAPAQEELIEFELVNEPQVPTRLTVPPAFNYEARADAAPPLRSREAIAAGAAVSRRKEMVSGLPLVSSILADEPPAAQQVAPSVPGKSRGQCSACGTMLWAPATRPLRLRCPRCGHVRTLTE